VNASFLCAADEFESEVALSDSFDLPIDDDDDCGLGATLASVSDMLRFFEIVIFFLIMTGFVEVAIEFEVPLVDENPVVSPFVGSTFMGSGLSKWFSTGGLLDTFVAKSIVSEEDFVDDVEIVLDLSLRRTKFRMSGLIGSFWITWACGRLRGR